MINVNRVFPLGAIQNHHFRPHVCLHDNPTWRFSIPQCWFIFPLPASVSISFPFTLSSLLSGCCVFQKIWSYTPGKFRIAPALPINFHQIDTHAESTHIPRFSWCSWKLITVFVVEERPSVRAVRFWCVMRDLVRVLIALSSQVGPDLEERALSIEFATSSCYVSVHQSRCQCVMGLDVRLQHLPQLQGEQEQRDGVEQY